MPVSPRWSEARTGAAKRRLGAASTEPLPMVEIVLKGVDGDDWVSETLRSHGAGLRLLACRPADRGKRRLLRLFEIRTNGTGIEPIIRGLRSRLAARDIAVARLSPDRALLRVSVPMPSGCSAAFEMGDICISCPFLENKEGKEPTAWNLLVPRIGDARRLLRASARRGGPRPSLVRAGAYRRGWGLTGRQEQALRTAFHLGYFDYPRRAPLSTVANRLGVGRSTALELLRRATAKLASERFLTEPPIGRAP